MRDQAGNYVFEVGDNTYSIMRMGWRQQRNIIGKIKNSIDFETGELIPFCDGYNELQDYLLPMIRHHTSEGFKYLDDEYLEVHVETIAEVTGNANIVNIINEIFLLGIQELTQSFFVKDSHQTNSNQPAVESLEKANPQTMLSMTLKK